MGLACMFERRLLITDAPAPPRSTPLKPARPPPQRFATPSPLTVTGASSAPPPSRPRPAPGTRFSRLTPEEMAHRNEKGRCFNCPAKFSREHLKECTMQGIYLPELEGETMPAEGDSDDVHIYSNAVTGITTASTMHLGLAMAGALLRALVDSGSTHCFVATDVACRLGLVLSPRPGMTVGVANSDRIPRDGYRHRR